MRRLRCFILIFCLALSLPLAYVTWRTYNSLAHEEQAQLSFFSETLIDRMERELALLVQREESRSVEEYSHTLIQDDSSVRLSPLAKLPPQPFILGYFQNNPDGSLQTPLVADLRQVPAALGQRIEQLREINRVFNSKKFNLPPPLLAPSQATVEKEEMPVEKKDSTTEGLAERYLARESKAASKLYLGQQQTRTEEITARQALNLAADESSAPGPRVSPQRSGPPEASPQRSGPPEASPRRSGPPEASPQAATKASPSRQDRLSELGDKGHLDSESSLPTAEPPAAALGADADRKAGAGGPAAQRFQVEVAPFQSVFITQEQAFIFRRVAIGNQIYRQGFVIQIPQLLHYLAETRFSNQPLSDFMTLRLAIVGETHRREVLRIGPQVPAPRFAAERRMPAPFNFLEAVLEARSVPTSPARRPLIVALAMLGAVVLLGLFAIYQSARTVVAMSERRSQFVSSVTHELKTPLTNIRMYIEMLEQGIAATPQREREYLHVLDTESARLSRLINNVLELAKLEKRQRRFHYEEGDLSDVFSEVSLIMSGRLKQADFDLVIDTDRAPRFAYDREVLIQLMVNLIENSIKFGRQSHLRRIAISAEPDGNDIRIAVSDTGPGIPRQALKNIFNDFYRVDSELTRTAGGTGIGLALVKKFVTAMGGTVAAANNQGAGCTITIRLPRPLVQT